jgi:hypothetical protein
MALLNLTAFAPQMAFSVCATVEALGGDAPLETVERWMSPEVIYADESRPKTAGLGLREAINLCESIGIIDSAAGSLRLCEAFESLAHFRRRVRSRVLEPERNLELFSPSPEGGVRAHELTRALVWFLQLKSTSGPYSTTNYEQFQSSGNRVIENDTRWSVFDRWAVFLGFGWRAGGGLVPDPSAAILDVLDEVLPSGEVGLPILVSHLAEQLPVLDGGAYHAAHLAAAGTGDQWDGRRLSEPLSLALMRLERRGVLELFGGGDAEARVLTVGADVDRSNQFAKRLARREESA